MKSNFLEAKSGRRTNLLWLLFFALLPVTTFAHDGDTVSRFGSFVGGFAHPVLGLDHLLAMLSVGIVSAQMGGKAIWTVPLTFVVMMAVGGLIGFMVSELPFIEIGIALSVLVLGITIAADRKLPIGIAMTAVGLFAMFHGFAHGAEMPSIATPFKYASGFLTGTAFIHIMGVFLGDIPRHYKKGPLVLRILGGAIAICGLLFLLGII